MSSMKKREHSAKTMEEKNKKKRDGREGLGRDKNELHSWLLLPITRSVQLFSLFSGKLRIAWWWHGGTCATAPLTGSIKTCMS